MNTHLLQSAIVLIGICCILENQNRNLALMKSTTFSGFDALSKKEQDLFKELQYVSPSSIWGISIHNVITKGDACTFRRMVCQLKSQADDCADTMIAVMGIHAYNALQKL